MFMFPAARLGPKRCQHVLAGLCLRGIWFESFLRCEEIDTSGRQAVLSQICTASGRGSPGVPV